MVTLFTHDRRKSYVSRGVVDIYACPKTGREYKIHRLDRGFQVECPEGYVDDIVERSAWLARKAAELWATSDAQTFERITKRLREMRKIVAAKAA